MPLESDSQKISRLLSESAQEHKTRHLKASREVGGLSNKIKTQGATANGNPGTSLGNKKKSLGDYACLADYLADILFDPIQPLSNSSDRCSKNLKGQIDEAFANQVENFVSSMQITTGAQASFAMANENAGANAAMAALKASEAALIREEQHKAEGRVKVAEEQRQGRKAHAIDASAARKFVGVEAEKSAKAVAKTNEQQGNAEAIANIRKIESAWGQAKTPDQAREIMNGQSRKQNGQTQ